MSREKLNIISEILQANQSIITFHNFRITANGDFKLLEKACTDKGITTEDIGNSLIIKPKSFITKNLIFYDEYKRTFESNFINEEFAILKTNGEYCFHESDSSDLYFNNIASEDFIKSCSNIFHYYKLYNFLKSNEFADHHNSANTEIVIYSSAKGIFKIKYNSLPELNFRDNISNKVEQLFQNASPVQIRSFFKNSLFTFSNGTGIIYIDEIIDKANDIITATIRDFELISKQFDFDKFRDSLYKEKEKYFNNIREIISKIFGQAIGIPISISAAVFATYKVSDDTLMLILVMLSFIIYVAFYLKIQLVYKSDIQEIEKEFNSDFEIIILKSGLPQDLIKKEKQKIERKISSSISMVNYLIAIVSGLGLLVCSYFIYEISKSETICLIKMIFKIF